MRYRIFKDPKRESCYDIQYKVFYSFGWYYETSFSSLEKAQEYLRALRNPAIWYE